MTEEARSRPKERETTKETGALLLAIGGLAAAFGAASCCAIPMLLGSNPAPDRHAGRIPDLPEFVSPSRAFYLGKVAVALEHQVSDAPDIDVRDHAKKGTVGPLLAVKAPAKPDPRSPPTAKGLFQAASTKSSSRIAGRHAGYD